MKLSQKTEWGIIAILIAYLAFTPGFQIVKDILATPVGKAAALVGIVYTWKYVSAIIAILLLIGYMRCAKNNVWEMFSGAEGTCLCEGTGFIWDDSVKKCKNAEGQEGKIKSCTCTNGYAWDTATTQCISATTTQPPISPVPIPGTSSTTAPAVSTGPVTSSAPMTTPSATQTMVTSTSPSLSASSGVQATTSSSTSNVSPIH